MTDYWDMRKTVVEFLNESKISAYDLARISKDLCTCGTCAFFVQHYTEIGELVDFGHCKKNNQPKSRKPNNESCAFWKYDEVKTHEEYENNGLHMYVEWRDGMPSLYRYGDESAIMALSVDGGYRTPEEAKAAYYKELEQNKK